MTQSKDDSRNILNKLLKFQVPQIKQLAVPLKRTRRGYPHLYISIYIYLTRKLASYVNQVKVHYIKKHLKERVKKCLMKLKNL